MRDNPYAWNRVNPDLCYGRDELLRELLPGLQGHAKLSFGIAGGRRMGKTTLLRRTEQELVAAVEGWRRGGLLVVPIYVDGLQLRWPIRSDAIWGTLLRLILKAMSRERVDTPADIDFQGFKELLSPIMLEIPERPRIIVMFDEIEPIIVQEWSQTFLDNWQALLSNIPDLSPYFAAVFTGAHEMAALQRDLGSPLRGVLEWRNLHALDLGSATRLMEEPIGVRWSEEFVGKVFDETGGHPMLLQYIMHQVCNADGHESAVETAVARFERDRGWQFEEWWVRYCTPVAQRVYARLPDDKSYIRKWNLTREYGSMDVGQALAILQHVGIGFVDEEKQAVRYAGEMFRRWFRLAGVVDTTARHDAQLYQRLLAVDAQAAGKYLSAWRTYEADLPDYSGAMAEVREALTLLLSKLAPEDEVMAAPGFKCEGNTGHPTRRQLVRHAVRRVYQDDRTRSAEIVSDVTLLETLCDQVAWQASHAYQGASNIVHSSANRDLAYRALKQRDGILAQLIPGA